MSLSRVVLGGLLALGIVGPNSNRSYYNNYNSGYNNRYRGGSGYSFRSGFNNYRR